MPGHVDEAHWNAAEKAVAHQHHLSEHDGDRYWRLVQSVYQRMESHSSGSTNLHKTLLREQGAAVNPQDEDDVADVMMQENGVVEPETMEPQGETDQPQPGMIRVYDKHGRKTRAVINPEGHPKPMVYSKRAVIQKAVNEADQALIEDLAEAIHNIWMGWAVHAAENVNTKIRKRWKAMMMPYSDLPEAEKQKDRVEAIALLDITREQWLKKSHAVIRKSQESGEHWITIHPNGAGSHGRHVLIDGEGRIVGGAVPKFFHGKSVTEIHGKPLRTHWKGHQKEVETARKHLKSLEKQIAPLAREYARMQKENNGPSLHQRIAAVTGGHMISSHPRHVGDLMGEFRETVPAHLKRKLGGVPIDEVAEMLDTDTAGLLDLMREYHVPRQMSREEFHEMAEQDIKNGDEYRVMQRYLEALLEEAGAYRGKNVQHKKRAVSLVPVTKSRHNAHEATGAFVRKGSRDHREADTQRWQAKTRGINPNPPVVRKKRPRPGMLPKEAGNPLGSPMQESSMQVLGAITQSKRREPRKPDWGFDPLANLPGNTANPKPVGKPGIFMYKSDPEIAQAVKDYAALLDAGKSPAVAIHLLSDRYRWVQDFDTPRGRDWWAAVRRADLAVPRAFEGLDTEMDPDDENGPRPKHAVFWKQTPSNLGQGIMTPTGSGGAGR